MGNPVVATCVEKIYKGNKVIGYKLKSSTGEVVDVKAENLRNAMSNNIVNITNLKLTSNNRIIDKNSANLQRKPKSKASDMGQMVDFRQFYQMCRQRLAEFYSITPKITTKSVYYTDYIPVEKYAFEILDLSASYMSNSVRENAWCVRFLVAELTGEDITKLDFVKRERDGTLYLDDVDKYASFKHIVNTKYANRQIHPSCNSAIKRYSTALVEDYGLAIGHTFYYKVPVVDDKAKVSDIRNLIDTVLKDNSYMLSRH